MCGACGRPHDPDGARVAGPRRRAAVARAVQDTRAGLVVRAVPGGWTVATRTGRARVARTLGELLDAVAPPGAKSDQRDALRSLALTAAGGVAAPG